MNAKAFIDSIMSKVNNGDNEIEFLYHTPESKFLYIFRERHYGDYYDVNRGIDRHRTWVMVQHQDRPEIKIDITNISCSFTKNTAIAICNRIIDEINDVMRSRYGKSAILIDHVA